MVHAESEIKNEYNRDKKVAYKVEVFDRDGKSIKSFEGTQTVVKPGETATLEASAEIDGLHFWSWGYGYLYTVKTSLWVDGRKVDEVATRTGFRKTRFGKGMIWLNDRVIQMKGFAQRTSNEWPGVGMSVPAWLSDYSNGLMVEDNANLVRWMHITPWKQDIESCDRVGLIQAMQAGDAEKDREGRQWEQRTELMRDAIIYNRNNPSILFYECGNESISREHMIEMKAIRDKYDPHGAVPSVPVKCLIFVKPNMVARCFISIRANIIRCGPWNTAVMKVCVNIGMNILIHIIKMGKEIIHSVLQ